jgi:hypothetical protein
VSVTWQTSLNIKVWGWQNMSFPWPHYNIESSSYGQTLVIIYGDKNCLSSMNFFWWLKPIRTATPDLIMSQKWPCPSCNGHIRHITQHNGQGLDHSVVVLQSPRWISSTWQQTSFGSPSREHMLASGNRDDQRTACATAVTPHYTHTWESSSEREYVQFFTRANRPSPQPLHK